MKSPGSTNNGRRPAGPQVCLGCQATVAQRAGDPHAVAGRGGQLIGLRAHLPQRPIGDIDAARGKGHAAGQSDRYGRRQPGPADPPAKVEMIPAATRRLPCAAPAGLVATTAVSATPTTAAAITSLVKCLVMRLSLRQTPVHDEQSLCPVCGERALPGAPSAGIAMMPAAEILAANVGVII